MLLRIKKNRKRYRIILKKDYLIRNSNESSAQSNRYCNGRDNEENQTNEKEVLLEAQTNKEEKTTKDINLIDADEITSPW